MMSIERRKTKDSEGWKDAYDRPIDYPRISKGYLTMSVPISLFINNRQRLVKSLRIGQHQGLVCLLSPASNDWKCNFQEQFLFWAFGCQEPGMMGVLDLTNEKSYFIVPRLNKDIALWNGLGPTTRNYFEKNLLVDGVCYSDETELFLDFLIKHNTYNNILILAEQKNVLPKYIFRYNVDETTLGPVIRNLRTIKTEDELRILRYTVKILECSLMRITNRLKPGMNFKQIESWFVFFMSFKGGFENLKLNIFNDWKMKKDLYSTDVKEQVTFKEDEIYVIEAGAAYFGYHMSVAATIPVGNYFNEDQYIAYDTVLRMRDCIFRHLKIGTSFNEIRVAAERCLLSILINEIYLLYGKLRGALNARVADLFLPDSLVRLLDFGCEEMDKLQLGKVYLIISGCDFTKVEDGLKNEVFGHYLKADLLRFRNIVVQLNDPVLITEYGFEFLSDQPNQLCDIHQLMNEDCSVVVELEKPNLTVTPSMFSIP